MLLPPLHNPCDRIAMDILIDLPESTKAGYTRILVTVDRITKMAIYLPWLNDINSLEQARMFLEHMICKHGIQNNIFTDGGFQTPVCSHMPTDHRLLTAFHLQTIRLTEWQNHTIEQYLRAFCHCEQDI